MNITSLRLNLLIQMKNTLKGEFNLDHLDIINSYLKDTNLKCRMIYKWLETARRQALTRPLDPKFSIVRRDFVTYLDKRITTFQACILDHSKSTLPSNDNTPPKAVLEQDIWRREFEKSSEKAVDLLKASMHIQDLLFSCHEVVQHLNTQAEHLLKKELKPFIKKFLPVYLDLLDSASDQLKSDIYESIVELKACITRGDFEKAENQLNLIQARIKSSQKAN